MWNEKQVTESLEKYYIQISEEIFVDTDIEKT